RVVANVFAKPQNVKFAGLAVVLRCFKHFCKTSVLKSKINKRISFTDDERRTLVESAMAMGRDLMEQVVTIVQPETILA
ncbi:MAG: hypothetical protein B6I25_02450, partial [Planctomycetales bacterium 4572_13]